MLSFILAACVGLAGDVWSYSKTESSPSVPRSTVTVRTNSPPAKASSGFTGHLVTKYVEHTATTTPTTPAMAKTEPEAPGKPVVAETPPVKPQAPRRGIPKATCGRCSDECGCGSMCLCNPCQCNAKSHVAGGKLQWWTLPEDPTLEGYGEVVYDNGEVVLKYQRLRPKQVAVKSPPQQTSQVTRYTVTPTYYYPTTYQVPTQAPMYYCPTGYCPSGRG